MKADLGSKQERVKKYGEVFTPLRVVKMMCDELERENPDCYRIDSTFLEPSCGEGVFVCEILRRKFANCKTQIDYNTALNSVWAFDIQADNVQKTIQNVIELCGEYFKVNKAHENLINLHIIQADALKVIHLLTAFELIGSERIYVRQS